MGLEEVISDVISRAETESASIKKEGQTEADTILSKAKANANEMENQNQLDVERQISQMRKREISSQSLENKKELLNMQKDTIESVYTKTEQKLASLPTKEKEKLIKISLEKATENLDAKYLYCRKEDEALVKKLAPDLEVSATLNSIGGIIVEDAYHERMENYTFEAIMERVRDSTLPDVSKILFGGNK